MLEQVSLGAVSAELEEIERFLGEVSTLGRHVFIALSLNKPPFISPALWSSRRNESLAKLIVLWWERFLVIYPKQTTAFLPNLCRYI